MFVALKCDFFKIADIYIYLYKNKVYCITFFLLYFFFFFIILYYEIHCMNEINNGEQIENNRFYEKIKVLTEQYKNNTKIFNFSVPEDKE